MVNKGTEVSGLPMKDISVIDSVGKIEQCASETKELIYLAERIMAEVSGERKDAKPEEIEKPADGISPRLRDVSARLESNIDRIRSILNKLERYIGDSISKSANRS